MRGELEKSINGGKEHPQVEEKEVKSETKDRQEIIDMTPKQLREYFIDLEENDQLQPFLERAIDDEILVAQLSYWEKWLKKQQRDLFEGLISRKKEMYPGDKESMPLELDKKFSNEELEIILSNVGAIQLTHGCSKGCPFCGLDAVPGVRDYIPYAQLAKMFQDYGKQIGKTRPLLYWASEPSDYNIDDKTYEDVHELAEKYAGYAPHVTSKEIDDEQWLEFLNLLGKKRKVRASVYGQKKENIDRIFEQYKDISLTGIEEEHQMGIGVSSMRKKEEVTRGIACFDGMLITPRGLFNVIQTIITEKNPQGLEIVPFEGLKRREIRKGEKLERVLADFLVPISFQRLSVGDWRSNPINSIRLLDKDNERRIIILDDKSEVVLELQNFKSAKYINKKRKEFHDLIETEKQARTEGDKSKLRLVRDRGKTTREDIEQKVLEEVKNNFSENGKIRKISLDDLVRIKSTSLEKAIGDFKTGRIAVLLYRDREKDSFKKELEELKKGVTRLFKLTEKNGDWFIDCENSEFSFEYPRFNYPGSKVTIDIVYRISRKLNEKESKIARALKGKIDEDIERKPNFSVNEIREILDKNISFDIILNKVRVTF